MNSKKIVKIVAIYSVILGTISLIGQLSEETELNVLSILLSIAIIINGIILLNPNGYKESIEKAIMITLLVFYSVLQLSTLVIISYNVLLGIIVEMLIVLPFTLCIMYLVKLKKEYEEKSKRNNGNGYNKTDEQLGESVLKGQVNEGKSNSLELELNMLKSLFDSNAISKEEYDFLRNKAIERY